MSSPVEQYIARICAHASSQREAFLDGFRKAASIKDTEAAQDAVGDVLNAALSEMETAITQSLFLTGATIPTIDAKNLELYTKSMMEQFAQRVVGGVMEIYATALAEKKSPS